MFFLKEYKPKKIKKPDVYKARKKILENQNKNLNFLLEQRFGWMSKYLINKKNIIELGAGNGCIKQIIKNKNIILTDITKYSWIDKKVDMVKLNLHKKYINKVDVFIINHALHHCANPSNTLLKMTKYLKKNGLILMNEPEPSFFLTLLQYILDDEGWSFKINIFNNKKNISNSNNPWVSNTAIANLLFKNQENFYKHFPQYKIMKNQLTEFLTFLNSGGVNSNFLFISLGRKGLKVIKFIDKILISIFPSIFALNRSVVLKKIK